MTKAVASDPLQCTYCGYWHAPIVCPRVKCIHYADPLGNIAQIEFHSPDLVNLMPVRNTPPAKTHPTALQRKAARKDAKARRR